VTGSDVERVRPGDIQPLSRVLARAFRHDPFHRWLFPSERAWARRSHRTFALLLRESLARQTVLTTPGREGAAIWASPSDGRASAAAQIALAARMAWLLGARFPLAMRGFRWILEAQPRPPFWYLGVVGTDPLHQGKGVGSALVAFPLARCDEQRLPVYLEASRPENVPFYRRFGFEVTEEIRMPRGGPSVFGMLREPAAK
jgi:GNAT superfamily N-acetyltransferase